MTSWRSAWRSLRKAAGLPQVRFHDGRHTALTRLAEKGVADWVIRAQFGHVSPAMMAVYSHVRRKALDEAAKALQPDSMSTGALTPEPAATSDAALLSSTEHDGAGSRVVSHVTSQQAPSRHKLIEFPKESGAPCRTRTCDLLVRSQTLYPAELRARWENVLGRCLLPQSQGTQTKTIPWGRRGSERTVWLMDRLDQLFANVIRERISSWVCANVVANRTYSSPATPTQNIVLELADASGTRCSTSQCSTILPSPSSLKMSMPAQSPSPGQCW